MSAKIHELSEYRNRESVFEDRAHAGEVVARMLEPAYGDRDDAIVLAIPSGGVPVGLEISRRLGLDFDLVIVRKIQIPGNTEAGFGAVTLDGGAFLNEALLGQLGLSPAQVEAQAAKVREELMERNHLFRGGRPFPELGARTAILVDDGLASGYTMKASISAVRTRGTGKIVVAIPTAPKRSVEMIEPLADEIYCPNIRMGPYFAVAAAYRNWYDLDSGEVIRLLTGHGNQRKPS